MLTAEQLTSRRWWALTAVKTAVLAFFFVWLWHAYLVFVLSIGTVVGLQVLMHKSETASTVMGLPADERWESINTRAFALAAKVMCIVLWTAICAFASMDVTGAAVDYNPYLLTLAGLVVAYIGGIIWYRWRQ
jgi:hypothetical protein